MSRILSVFLTSQILTNVRFKLLTYLSYVYRDADNEMLCSLLLESDNILQWVRIAGKVVFRTLSALRCGQTGHRDFYYITKQSRILVCFNKSIRTKGGGENKTASSLSFTLDLFFKSHINVKKRILGYCSSSCFIFVNGPFTRFSSSPI